MAGLESSLANPLLDRLQDYAMSEQAKGENPPPSTQYLLRVRLGILKLYNWNNTSYFGGYRGEYIVGVPAGWALRCLQEVPGASQQLIQALSDLQQIGTPLQLVFHMLIDL